MVDPYSAWSLDVADYSARAGHAEKLRFFARFGVLAPSVHNSQPWHIDVSADAINIRPAPRHRLPHADPDDAYLRMSLGMAAENIAVAARWFGHDADMTIATDGAIAIVVTDGGRPRGTIDATHIVKRTSDKFAYEDAAIPAALLADVADAARQGDAHIHFVVLAADRRRVVDAHARAIAATAANADFARELGSMLRSNISRETRGIPGLVAGVGLLPSLIVPPLLQRYPALLTKLVRNEAEHVIAHSAGFGFVLSRAGGADADVGRAYQRAALLLRQAGAVDALMTAAVADAETRAVLTSALRLAGTPRLLFRLGYPRGPRRHTPRDPLGV